MAEEEKNKGGRPLLFESVEALEVKIEEYFKSCFEEIWTQEAIREKKKIIGYKWVPVLDRHGNIEVREVKPFTITGLAVYLNTSRQTLLNYEERGEFFDTIKRAKDKIENYAEESLYTSKQTAGIIFNLVNNHKWINRQEVDQNLTVNQKLEDFFK